MITVVIGCPWSPSIASFKVEFIRTGAEIAVHFFIRRTHLARGPYLFKVGNIVAITKREDL